MFPRASHLSSKGVARQCRQVFHRLKQNLFGYVTAFDIKLGCQVWLYPPPYAPGLVYVFVTVIY